MSATHLDASTDRGVSPYASTTILLCLTATMLASGPARAFSRVFTESTVDDISHVYEYSVTLQASSTYTFSTNELTTLGSCPADTVLHVVDAATGAWIASDDDCGTSLRSCVTVTTPAGTAKLYKAIVHAYSSCTTASGRFQISGPGVTDPYALATFGGNVISSDSGFGWGTNDRIELIKLMRTASNPTSLRQSSSIRAYVLTWPSGSCATDALQVHKIASAGIQGNRLINMGSASSNFCRAKLVVGTTSSTETGANCRVYVNDHSTDTDADGIGNALEAALGTCPSVGGAGCSLAVNPMDTDRDGLSDSAELIGVPVSYGVPLAYFGADPRQKDVFVEVDWDETSTNPEFVTGLTGAEADAIQSETYTTTTGNPRNPNGSNRIHLHLDIGVNSCDPTTLVCSSTWGYWGGANGADSNDFRLHSTDNMSLERQAIFFYGLARAGGAGEADGRRFTFGAKNSDTAKGTFRHELGHCLGLKHDGDPSMLVLNSKPSYFSLMNYAFDASSFSNGQRATLVSTVLNEVTGVGGDNSYLNERFDFARPTTANIDWNRNGVIDVGTTVAGVTRASANLFRAATEAVHRAQGTASPMGVKGNTTVAAAELDGELLVFFRSDSNGLRYNKYVHPLTACSSVGPSTATCCSISANDACGGFSGETAISGGGDLTSSVSATALTLIGNPYVALAYSRGTGGSRRFYARYMDQDEVVLPETLLSPANLLSNAIVGSGDPVLVRKPSSNYLDMFYLDTSNKLRHVQLDISLGVYSNNEARSSANAPYTMEWPPGAAVDASGVLYLVTDQPWASGRELKVLQHASGSTFNVVPGGIAAGLASGNNQPIGRPALQHDDTRDAWEVWYPVQYPSSGVPLSRRLFSQGGFPIKHGRSEPYRGFTIDSPGGATLAMYRGHLQAFLAADGSAGVVGVHHAPYASGVFPFPEPDNDDWLTMHNNMCIGLKYPSCSICVPLGTSCSSAPPEGNVCDEWD